MTGPMKRCSCGAEYSAAEYLELRPPAKGGTQVTEDEEGAPLTLHLRQCACGSTLAVPASALSGVLPLAV